MSTCAKKSRKSIGAKGGDDLISNLPDDTIGKILSLLPTEHALRTSVLSKAWELKWKLIYNVNIDDAKLLTKPRSHKVMFVTFVNRILYNLSHIKSFHLKISYFTKYDFLCVTSWVSVVCGHKLESLELEVCRTMRANHKYLVLPHVLLHCATLKNLLVDMPCTFDVGTSNCFPNLSSLYLGGVKIRNGYPRTDKVIFHFPVLTEFTHHDCKWLKLEAVEINAPSLTTFNCITPSHSYGIETPGYSIEIIGAKLETFTTETGYPENIILAGSTVTHARLAGFFDNGFLSLYKCGLQTRKLLRELSHLKSLSLFGILMAVAETKYGIPLPRFPEMEKLDTIVDSRIDVEGLFELLDATPFLKSLEIYLDDSDSYAYDFDGVESVPSCIVSQLTKLTLDYSVCEKKPRFQLAKFFLKNGLQLKNVYVRGSPYFSERKIVRKLLKFPKGSTSLAIQSIA